MKIKLTERSDVLHITLVATENHCESVEAGPGIICRIDNITQEVVGITVMDFSERARKGFLIPDLIAGIPAANLLAENARSIPRLVHQI